MNENNKAKLVATMQNQSVKKLSGKELKAKFISESDARRALNDKYSSSVEFANKIEDISNDIFEVIRDFAERKNVSVGNLKLVLVGGRLKNKPLDLDSDLDILFYVDSGADELSRSWRQIYAEVESIFNGLSIKPDRFHFSAFENMEQYKKIKKPYITLLSKRVN